MLDLGGNVSEYTSSFPCTYPEHSCTGNKGAARVTRGGNYATNDLTEMCAAHRSSASWQTHYYGIRCARDASR